MISYKYDALGNLINKTDARGNRTYYEYDSSNNLTKVTDALGHVTNYTYDKLDNVKKITYSDNRSVIHKDVQKLIIDDIKRIVKGEEMEHSEAYQLFMKQKDSIDYAIKREGYRDDLLQSIYPEERTEVETLLVSLLKQQDISVLKFMHHITTFDGISIVAEQYEKLKKQTMDTPNLANYLYIHTKEKKYLEDLLEYCFDNKHQYREEALKNLSTLVLDLELREISQLYQISRKIILSENDSELLFWAKAIMRKCVKRLDIIGEDDVLRQRWEEVVDAIKDGNCERRTEKLIAFERNIKMFL